MFASFLSPPLYGTFLLHLSILLLISWDFSPLVQLSSGEQLPAWYCLERWFSSVQFSLQEMFSEVFRARLLEVEEMSLQLH